MLVPSTSAALATILSQASHQGHSVYTSVTTPEVTPDADIHVSLRNFVGIQFDADGNLVVGAAAKMLSIASALEKKKRFVPLNDRVDETVVSAVRDPALGYFVSSVGAIKDFVKEVRVVTQKGDIQVIKMGEKDRLAQVLDIASSDIITEVVFRTLGTDDISRLWLARMLVPYSKKVYEKIVHNAFDDPGALPKKLDIAVQIKSLRDNVDMINVTITGQRPHNKAAQAIANVVKVLFKGGKYQLAEKQFTTYTGRKIVKAILAANDMGAQTLGRLTAYHRIEIKPENVAEFTPKLLAIIEEFDGTNDVGVSNYPKLSLSLRLTQTKDDGLAIAAHVIGPRTPKEEDKALCAKFENLVPTIWEYKPKKATVDRGLDIRSLFTTPKPDVDIPNFEGAVYDKKDGEAYLDAIEQYATSSYPEEDMSPFLIAYPESVSDVRAAIEFAKKIGKKIVPRSGGHQYSGLSSGGNDTIVLAMDAFSGITRKTIDGKAHMVIGVSEVLDRISTSLLNAKTFLPHGQCPTVGIGGHMQSGGYGLTLHSYGLLSDWVYSFDIVLADGTSSTIFRPDIVKEKTDVHPENDDIYYAVLGGGPGSWGVVMYMTLEVIPDAITPGAGGVKGNMSYHRDRMAESFKLLRRYSIEVYEGTLPEDTNLSLSISKLDYANTILAEVNDLFGDDSEAPEIPFYVPSVIRTFVPGVIILELAYGNRSGKTYDENDPEYPVNGLIRDYDNVASKGGILQIDSKGYRGPTPLSEMSDQYVQRAGTVSDGREFVYPYKKRLNGTSKPLTEEYIQELTDIMDDAMHERGIYVVLLTVLGGGAFKDSPNRKFGAGQHRDSIVPVVFDIFYGEGFESLAEDYQDRMTSILSDTVKEKDTLRYAWGTFGDTDINNVWPYYYDDEATYNRLREIKSKIDPEDVFSTRFTIPPAKH